MNHDAEIAALVAVLTARRQPTGARSARTELMGRPVNKLRYSAFSWPRVTLLERSRMR